MVDFKNIALLLAFQAPVMSLVICIYYALTLGRNGYTRIEHFLAKMLAIACIGNMLAEIVTGLINFGFITDNKSVYIWTAFVGYVFMLLSAIFWCEFSLSRAHNPSVLLAVVIRMLYFVVLVILTARIAFKDSKLFIYIEDDVTKYGPFDDLQTYVCIVIYVLLLIVMIMKYTDRKEFVYKERHGKLIKGNMIVLIGMLIYGICYFPYVVWISYTFLLLYIYMYNQKSSIYKDELTNLENRRSMIKDISEKIHEERGLSVIMIDVNSFKTINDNFGHSEGDLALGTVAGIIGDASKSSNAKAYRYGGDEFVVVCDFDEEERVREFCADLDKRFEDKNEEKTLPYLLSISSGYVIYDANTMESIPDIIEMADKRMYEDKLRKKNNAK